MLHRSFGRGPFHDQCRLSWLTNGVLAFPMPAVGSLRDAYTQDGAFRSPTQLRSQREHSCGWSRPALV
jgi:hypothetical protein